ncbi:MAG: DUF4160 domain-containing protein [Bacteroidales bacterium]|nr:DUF4160 domain-containing protein [Bacteroidales bacterium]
MPEISRFYGIVITMYFPDHNPPHFHIRHNEYRATMDIATGKITGRIPEKVDKMVHEWWEEHQDELWTNWKKMQNGETMFKINPLIKHEEY